MSNLKPSKTKSQTNSTTLRHQTPFSHSIHSATPHLTPPLSPISAHSQFHNPKSLISLTSNPSHPPILSNNNPNPNPNRSLTTQSYSPQNSPPSNTPSQQCRQNPRERSHQSEGGSPLPHLPESDNRISLNPPNTYLFPCLIITI